MSQPLTRGPSAFIPEKEVSSFVFNTLSSQKLTLKLHPFFLEKVDVFLLFNVLFMSEKCRVVFSDSLRKSEGFQV